MSKRKHTPEPWACVVNINDTTTYAIDNLSNSRSAYIADDLKEDDADRIVACVNACAGIEDPATAIGILRELAEQLRDGNSYTINPRDVYGQMIQKLFGYGDVGE